VISKDSLAGIRKGSYRNKEYPVVFCLGGSWQNCSHEILSAKPRKRSFRELVRKTRMSLEKNLAVEQSIVGRRQARKLTPIPTLSMSLSARPSNSKPDIATQDSSHISVGDAPTV